MLTFVQNSGIGLRSEKRKINKIRREASLSRTLYAEHDFTTVRTDHKIYSCAYSFVSVCEWSVGKCAELAYTAHSEAK